MSTVTSRRRPSTIQIQGDGYFGHLSGPRDLIRAHAVIFDRLAALNRSNMDRRLLDHALDLLQLGRLHDAVVWSETAEEGAWLVGCLARAAELLKQKFYALAVDDATLTAAGEIAEVVGLIETLRVALADWRATLRPQKKIAEESRQAG